MLKKMFISAFMFFTTLVVLGQDMTIEETLSYINNRFAKMKSSTRYEKLTHTNEELGFEFINITTDGKISIHQKSRSYKWRDGAAFDDITWHINHELSAEDVDLEFSVSAIFVNCKKYASTSNCITFKTPNGSSYQSSTSFSFDDENIGESIFNALKHLIDKMKNDLRYAKKEEYDPFAPKPKNIAENPAISSVVTTTTKRNVVVMVKSSDGTYEIPVQINGVLKINFIFDSGASDVSISPDVALTLIKTGTVTKTDFIGTQKYVFADGTTANSKVFIIKNLKIGSKTVYNVRASISNSIDAPMLLGQSVLQKFGKFSIDNNTHTITLD